MKHTPGPWTAKPRGDGWHIEAHTPIPKEEAPKGATLYTFVATAHGMRGHNAKLIAAAPDLLEALKDMVSDRNNLSDATLQFARAAIEKAEGRA